MVKANLKNRATQDFLVRGPPKLLRLAVVLDGKPHISSVWYLWSRNHFWVSTSQDRLKVRAIKKNPRVALVIDTDTMPYEGVIVEGEAVLTKQNIRGITLAIVRKYVDKKSVQEQFDSLMRSPRILIKIKPIRSIDIMSYREH